MQSSHAGHRLCLTNTTVKYCSEEIAAIHVCAYWTSNNAL